MKKHTSALCSFAIVFASLIASGQSTSVSAGGNVVIPQSYGVKRVAGTGFGASLRLESSLGKHINGIATIEYLKFTDKKDAFSTTSFRAIPIQVGIKYYTTRKAYASKGFFISGELGIMPTTTVFDYTNGLPTFTFKESGLSIAPGIGYQAGRAEVSIRPQFNLTAAGFDVYYLNMRLAYAFIKTQKKKADLLNK